MRKLLFESLFARRSPKPAPSPDEAAVAELAARSARRRGESSAAAWRSARSTPAPATAANWKSTRSTTPIYDVERFGLRFVASPRHADVLLVTGPVTKNMREALQTHLRRHAGPKWVVACGDCARDGGCFAGSYAVVGGVSEVHSGRSAHPRLPAAAAAILKACWRCSIALPPRETAR